MILINCSAGFLLFNKGSADKPHLFPRQARKCFISSSACQKPCWFGIGLRKRTLWQQRKVEHAVGKVKQSNECHTQGVEQWQGESRDSWVTRSHTHRTILVCCTARGRGAQVTFVLLLGHKPLLALFAKVGGIIYATVWSQSSGGLKAQ